MATKKQEIDRLIQPKYGYPILQRLLAEIIYETRKSHQDSIDKRYKKLIKIIIHKPKKVASKNGYKHDDELLSRAAVMTQSCFRKDPKTGKMLKRALTVTEACEEIARLEIVKGYKFQTKLPETITENDKTKIRGMRVRLMSKLEGKVSHYARLNFKYGNEQDYEHTRAEQEIDFIKTLFPDWLRRFGSQVRFDEK